MAPSAWIFTCLLLSTSTHAFVLMAYDKGMFPLLPLRMGDTPTRSGVEDGSKSKSLADAEATSLVDQLWADNSELVDRFLNNKFSLQQASSNDTEALESFLFYSVQDYYYLLEYVNYEALTMTTYPPDSIDELAETIIGAAASMDKNAQYTTVFRNDLLDASKYDVPNATITNGHLHAPGLGYTSWLQHTTNLGWFASLVAKVPCVYGWVELAKHLKGLNSTVEDTLFYNEWILPNSGSGSGGRLKQLLDNHVAEYNTTRNYNIWNTLFRQGMSHEIAFFEGAVGKKLDDTGVWGT